jgi:prepilin signal peptidase PulO-like enzyme (type II secretory pathway)
MTFITVWNATFLGFFGACVGSFLAVVAERLPAKQSLMGRSHCVCGRQLLMLENIPIFSFTALRGRSRCCKVTIPAWYLLCEVVCAVLGIVAFVTLSVVAGQSLSVAFGAASVAWVTFGAFLTAVSLRAARSADSSGSNDPET